MAAQALTFQSTTFHAINHQGQPWLMGTEIARALGYSREDKISRLYNRNAGEFNDKMTALTEAPVSGFSNNLRTATRIFSLRGAHLLAMFARTPVAKDFRRWVLDILDKEIAVSPAPTSHTITSLVADPYQPYRAAADDCYRVAAQHGRGTLVAMLAMFDADHLCKVPLARLPEFVAICRKVTGHAPPVLQAPVLPVPVLPVPEPKRLLVSSGKSRWVSPVEVEEMLKAMRFREDQMYDFSLITPERVIELHQAGIIGPRQWAKLRVMIAH